ncbi:MAG TPA: hypothetical protein VN612_11895 [Acidobacteriaceae bacterium]|nr:hypothetical protein [Acidobacteriaceae bacterium]
MSPKTEGRGWLFRPAIAALTLFAIAPLASAQVLVHPGWARSHSAAEPWYKRAVFYEIGHPIERGSTCRTNEGAPALCGNLGQVDFKPLADQLDAMQSTGIDAIIVKPPALPSLSGASAEQAIAAQSALDAFDDFTRQATARGIRVLVDIEAAHADADLAGRARFWLTRGVAGLRLELLRDISPQERDAISASARSAAASIAGQRIVLIDTPGAAPATAPLSPRPAAARRSSHAAAEAAPQLEVLTLSGPLTAASLRPVLAQALSAPDKLLDTHPTADTPDGAHLADVLATIALVTGPSALLDPVQPLQLPATQPRIEPEDDSVKPPAPPIPQQPPPGVYLPYVPYVPPPRPQKKAAPPPPAPADPFTVWIGKLAALHHSNQALRTGSKTLLDFDAQNTLVWVARPSSPTPQNPPVVVLCNLSAQPVQLSLAEAVKKLNLHGFFLRTLLRSDSALGAQDLEAVKLPPYGVFIGELRR